MKNRKIVTVTLNPSLDKTLITHYLNIGYHNRVADTTHLDASGRGVNVSRALSKLEVATEAIVLLGSDAIGHAYRGLLAEETFRTAFIVQEGPTRSDTIIVDRGNGTETHIIDDGSGGTGEDIQRVIGQLERLVDPGDMAVFSGALPREAASESYLRLAQAAQAAGAQIVFMTGGEALSVGLKVQPELVALTRLEAESLFNYPVRTDADMISGGRKLRDQGAREAMIVADDYSRAVLITDDGVRLAEISETGPGTDSGVVDALLAGYLAGLMRGLPVEGAFELAAAAMNFTDSQIGNEFGTYEQVRQLSHRVQVSYVPVDEADGITTAGTGR